MICYNCFFKCCLCKCIIVMYSIFSNEKTFCKKCMMSDFSCEICEKKIWNYNFLNYYDEIVCCHYCNFLIQKTSHMIKFFDFVIVRFFVIPQKNIFSIVDMNKSFSFSSTEKSRRRIDFLINDFHSNTWNMNANKFQKSFDLHSRIFFTNNSSHNIEIKRKNIIKHSFERSKKKTTNFKLFVVFVQEFQHHLWLTIHWISIN